MKKRFYSAFFKSIHQARENNYKAKDLLIFACYVVILLIALPSSIEHISSSNTAESSSVLNYIMIVFVPLVRLVVEFGANLLGICALFVCAVLSVRYKILQNYALLFVLYLVCAYPSFLLLGVWSDMPANLLSIANSDFLELLRLVFVKKAYYMAIFIYAKRVCYVFLFFALFDMVFFALKNHSKRDFIRSIYHSIPKIVWWNLLFSLALCVATILAYLLCVGELVWHSWLSSIAFIFGF